MDKTELLYDHFKESFSLIKEQLDKRNRFFIMLFVTLAIQFLFALTPESISALITTIIKNNYEIDISGQIVIIQSLLWVILLYFTMRYYQSNVYIEKQYNYIHQLEESISNLIEVKFDREGGNYLENYPKMNDLIDFLYKWLFPIMYCLIVCYKIINEYVIQKAFSFPLLFNTIVFLACFVLTILYLIFLHCNNTN